MSRPTKKPSIPAAKDAFSSSVKQILEIFLGRGDKLDKVLTARDAIEIGFAKLAGAAKSTSETGLVPAGPVLDYTPPPQITGLTAVGGLASITLSWNQLTYANRSHVEVWRADVDDIGQAVLIGTSDASVYPDPIGSGAVKYYWARAVSTADKEGPYNAVAGTRGETGHDPAYVMDLLTSKRWQAATVYSLFQVVAPATPVVKNGITLAFQCTTAGTSGASEPNWNGVSGVGGQIADGTVVWTAVEAGTAPFVIGTINGVNVVAIHGALVVDGTLTGTKIQADAIGAEHISVVNLAAISANLGSITAGSMNINAKFIVDALGNVWATNAYVRGDVQATSLNAATGTFAGSLSAATGTFSGTLTSVAISAVDTINLAGQAVTIPVGAYTAASVAVGTGWSTVQQISINSSGSPIFIFASLGASVTSSSQTYSALTIRIIRDSTEIYSTAAVSAITNESSTNLAACSITDTPGAGSHTYYLQAIRTGASGSVDDRALLALEIKR